MTESRMEIEIFLELGQTPRGAAGRAGRIERPAPLR
jgi:hypothetical protein